MGSNPVQTPRKGETFFPSDFVLDFNAIPLSAVEYGKLNTAWMYLTGDIEVKEQTIYNILCFTALLRRGVRGIFRLKMWAFENEMQTWCLMRQSQFEQGLRELEPKAASIYRLMTRDYTTSLYKIVEIWESYLDESEPPTA